MFLSPLLLERYAPSSSIVEITSFFIFSFLGGGGVPFLSPPPLWRLPYSLSLSFFGQILLLLSPSLAMVGKAGE